jgi:ornithine decarboxylase
VATAGTAVLQVVVRRGNSIFLNDGVFGTLQELGNPKERRSARLIRIGGAASARMASFKVYGPTCDSNDVLGAPFLLPEDVREGDWIEIGMMGAYSLSMRTRFNGFHTDQVVALSD